MSTLRCCGVGLTAVAGQPAAAMWVMSGSSPVPPPVNTSPHPVSGVGEFVGAATAEAIRCHGSIRLTAPRRRLRS
jgi:hypothetical protein